MKSMNLAQPRSPSCKTPRQAAFATLCSLRKGKEGACDNFIVIGSINSNKLIGSGTIGRCDLADVTVSFLKEVCLCWGRLWGLFCLSFSWCYSPFPVACKIQESQLPLQHPVCLHATMLLTMMIMDWTTETVNDPLQLNVFLVKSYVVMGASSQQ